MPAEKMDGLSLNPQAELLALLKERAPEVFVEGRVDADKLAATLGQAVSTDKERYGLSWAGKGECFRHIQEPTTATLRPCRDESVDFDTTENVFIEGDNLNVLKVLQKSYYGRVKMIYIDPPYNTGSDSFIYPDKFSETQDEYLKRIGDKDAEGNLIRDGFWRKNSKDAGHFHSNWLSMMYPRLFLARNLLRQDGVIFVSIDDNEVHNLRMIMNEIFGEENFVASISVLCNPKGRSQDKYFATNHEYVLVYSKNILPKGAFAIAKEEDQIESEYPEEDDGGKYRQLELRNTHREFGKHNRKNLYYPFYVNMAGEISLDPEDGYEKVLPIWDDGYEGCWTWDKSKAEKDIALLVARQVKGDWKIYRKGYAHGADRMLKTILMEKTFYTERGQKEFNTLFDTKEKVFQSPKSPYLLLELLKTSTQDSDIVLDFFTGSGTTGHAVMQLNAEDGGNRRFICIQLPEPCDKDSEAYKAGFATIADIGRERIRRAAKKIGEESKGKLDFDGGTLDLGFKAFRLEESNFKPWRGVFKDAAELEQALTLFVDNVREGAASEDILYELILKAGLDVNVPVETQKKHGKTYYRLDGGRLIVCLEEKITQGLVDAMLAEKPQQLITLDRAFAGNDQLKTNTALQLEAEKIEFKVI